MSENSWKLGEDLATYDNILDGFTFDDIITAARCNCRIVDENAIRRTAREILEQRMIDYKYLLENNLREMIEEVKKQREGK